MGEGKSTHQSGGSIFSMRGFAIKDFPAPGFTASGDCAAEAATAQHAHPARKNKSQDRMKLSHHSEKSAEHQAVKTRVAAEPRESAALRFESLETHRGGAKTAAGSSGSECVRR
jgi:hypothetical protein